MRRMTGMVLLAAAAGLVGAPEPGDMPTVSYADLGKLVRGQRGKVTVVYFWANY